MGVLGKRTAIVVEGKGKFENSDRGAWLEPG